MPLLKDIIKPRAIKNLGLSVSESGEEIGQMVWRHLEWLLSRGYSSSTINSRGVELGEFISWVGIRGLTHPREVTSVILERYRQHLCHRRKANGQNLSAKTQNLRLIAVRIFLKWLVKTQRLSYNPASELELIKTGHPLPRHVLTLKEAEAIMNQVNLSSPMGLRDRAILETLYSTGIRRSELAHLKVYELNIEEGTLIIRKGKGEKDRVVPIGERAIAWIEKYLNELRPKLVTYYHDQFDYNKQGSRKGSESEAARDIDIDSDRDRDALFVTRKGIALAINYLGGVVSEYVKKAKIGKTGSCHLFRHTMATLMLEGGADIRYIKEMLGHEKLETTQIYTRVSIKKLKEVHNKTHPAANLKPRQKRS
jgi:integrase/recombinase XerD